MDSVERAGRETDEWLRRITLWFSGIIFSLSITIYLINEYGIYYCPTELWKNTMSRLPVDSRNEIRLISIFGICFCGLIYVGNLAVFNKKIIRKLRIARGHCPRCNYDLRATPEKCPECGKESLEHRKESFG